MRQYIYSTLKGFQNLNRKFEIKFTYWKSTESKQNY